MVKGRCVFGCAFKAQFFRERYTLVPEADPCHLAPGGFRHRGRHFCNQIDMFTFRFVKLNRGWNLISCKDDGRPLFSILGCFSPWFSLLGLGFTWDGRILKFVFASKSMVTVDPIFICIMEVNKLHQWTKIVFICDITQCKYSHHLPCMFQWCKFSFSHSNSMGL